MTTLREDTLRKAVEIARWQTTRLGNKTVEVYVPTDDPETVYRIGKLHDQHVKDALAAALVRWLDDLNPKDRFEQFDEGYVIEVDRGHAAVYEVGRICHSYIEGPNRTKNTINAVVEFAETRSKPYLNRCRP